VKEDNKEIKKGIFNKMKRFRSSVRVLLTSGSSSIITTPVYLGLILLIEEHSAG
jgi:hypothetical protein